jgi:hypothetical protein
MSGAAVVKTLDEQIQELKRYCDEVHLGEEAKVHLYLLKNLRLPTMCDPASCDALLSPTPHNGYPSRLYFPRVINGPFPRNWNFNGRILEENWSAFSFTVKTEGLSLAEILTRHLTGLAQAT